MQILRCEMCGGTDIIKQNGLYVCQHCGTKYTVEDARGLMTGSVDVSGSTIKIDRSDELMNLSTLAGREIESGNYDKAIQYFESMLLIDANSYSVIQGYDCVKVLRFNFDTFENDMDELYNHIPLVFGNMAENAQEDDAPQDLIIQAVEQIISTYDNTLEKMYFVASQNKEALENQVGIYLNVIDLRCKYIYDAIADQIEASYADIPVLMEKVVELRKKSIVHYADCIKAITDAKVRMEHIEQYKQDAERMKQYDPSFVAPKVGGCYIATAVYGSYDCPAVWVLRRFRDDFLAQYALGKCFINGYYKVSPWLVMYFGKNRYVKRVCEKGLNLLVAALKRSGMKDTPYKGC